MLNVAKELNDESLFIWLNNIATCTDAIANDVKYHLKCWVSIQRSVMKLTSHEILELDNLDRVIADVEIIDLVKNNSSGNDGDMMNMNNINKTYNNLLSNEQGFNCKRYLKTLLRDNIPELVFSRPPCQRSSEIPYCSSLQVKAVDALNNSPDDYKFIFQSASLICKEVLQRQDWRFSGDYSGFDIPNSLQTLLRWIIVGPKTSIDTKLKKQAVDNQISNISQIVMKATKTRKQVTQHKNFRDMVETPLRVGLALHLHKETRSEKFINCLYDIGLTISYDKVMKIENGLGNAVLENIESNRGTFIPSTSEIGKPLHFKIDNIDFKNDTANGKSEFHGTTLVAISNQVQQEE